MAFRPPPDERLFISWTGTDDQLNVIRAPDLSKTTMERSDPSGPALAFGAGKLFIAWKGTDDHPNCLWSFDGKKFVAKFTSGGDGPRESNPGIAFGRDMIFLSWAGSDNHIRLIQLRATDPISEIPLPLDVHRLPFLTGHKGTPALAFGGGKLFVVWSGFEPPHLIHVLKLVVAEDGTVPPQVMTATPINDWTNDTTGPATAFHAPGNRPYVAFTGADDRLYVISSTDDGASFPNRVILPAELSRHDAGPAIAVHSDGTVCVCWTGTDGD